MTAEAIRKRALLSWRLRLQTSGIYRDPAIPGDPSQIKSGGAAAYAASRPGLAPGVSAQVASLQSLILCSGQDQLSRLLKKSLRCDNGT